MDDPIPNTPGALYERRIVARCAPRGALTPPRYYLPILYSRAPAREPTNAAARIKIPSAAQQYPRLTNEPHKRVHESGARASSTFRKDALRILNFTNGPARARAIRGAVTRPRAIQSGRSSARLSVTI